MVIIIYASQYGTTRDYAMELSKRTGIRAENYTDIDDVNGHDTIVYLGALYAGSVMGLKKTFKRIGDCADKKIIIATVGLAAPDDEDNRNGIIDNIKRQLPEDVYNHSSIYFLRGGIDYSGLSIKHKTMMAFVHRRAKKLSEDEMTAEIRAALETYGKNVSYVDFDSLNPIIDEIG